MLVSLLETSHIYPFYHSERHIRCSFATGHRPSTQETLLLCPATFLSWFILKYIFVKASSVSALGLCFHLRNFRRHVGLLMAIRVWQPEREELYLLFLYLCRYLRLSAKHISASDSERSTSWGSLAPQFCALALKCEAQKHLHKFELPFFWFQGVWEKRKQNQKERKVKEFKRK